VAPPDEQNVSQPITGLGAGNGLLVVPAGNWLVAYEARPGAPSYACVPGGAVQVTLGAGTAGGGSPPGAGAAQPGAVTLSAGRHDIYFGQTVTLRGKTAPGATVQLQADPFPFGAFAIHKTATAAGDGSFSFRVKPDRNTAYKALAGGGQSGVTVVYSDARVAIVRKLSRSHRTLTLGVAAKGPADIPLRGRMVHFYYGHKGAKRLRHVAAHRFRRVRRGQFAVAASWRVSGYRKSDRVIACTRELKPDGFGRPLALDRKCGAKTLPNA
jgi:hypothetical protein